MAFLNRLKNLFSKDDVFMEDASSVNRFAPRFVRRGDGDLVKDPTVFCPYLLEETKRKGMLRRILSDEGSPLKQRVIDLPLHVKIFVRSDVRDDLLNVESEERIQEELSVLISKEDATINHLNNQRKAYIEILADEINVIRYPNQWYGVVKPLPPELDVLAELVELTAGGNTFKIGPRPRVLLCGSAPDCDIIISNLLPYHAKIEVQAIDNDYMFLLRPAHSDSIVKVKDDAGDPKQVSYDRPYRLKHLAKVWFNDSPALVFRRYADVTKSRLVESRSSRTLTHAKISTSSRKIDSVAQEARLENEMNFANRGGTRTHGVVDKPQASENSVRFATDSQDNFAIREPSDVGLEDEANAETDETGLHINISGILLYEIDVPYHISNIPSSRNHIRLADSELVGEITCTFTRDAWVLEDESQLGCLYDGTGQLVGRLEIPVTAPNMDFVIGSTKMRYEYINPKVFHARGIPLPIIGKIMFLDKNDMARRAQTMGIEENIQVGRLHHLPKYEMRESDYILSEKFASRQHAFYGFDSEHLGNPKPLRESNLGSFYVENISNSNTILIFPEDAISVKPSRICAKPSRESGAGDDIVIITPQEKYFFQPGENTQAWIGQTIFEICDMRNFDSHEALESEVAESDILPNMEEIEYLEETNFVGTKLVLAASKSLRESKLPSESSEQEAKQSEYSSVNDGIFEDESETILDDQMTASEIPRFRSVSEANTEVV